MSEDCCSQEQSSFSQNCPMNGAKGRRVQTTTLKSLLKGAALETLNPDAAYFFCATPDCPVVYFNEQCQSFIIDQVKVPIFQKQQGLQVPICYCFDWTRARICQEIKQTGNSHAETSIRTHIQAGRCGCEVNNPQGICCLANVRSFTKSQMSELAGG